LYCNPCETFYTELQLVEANARLRRAVGKTHEEAYFLKAQQVSGLADRLYRSHPDFILPPSVKNEMLNNF
jgi:methionyl-tRNA synthetase